MDKKFSFSGLVSVLKNILIPQASVAGLEFKDAAIRLAQIKNGDLKKASVMLEPGIIDNGKIKDRDKLISALQKLYAELETKDRVSVIAIVPSIDVYTKNFSTPILDQKSLKEAALLNLRSISPIDFEKSYSDWQQVGLKERDGKIDILGAFADGAVIDSYTAVLRETGFLPVAVEFSALATSRTIKEFGAGIDLSKPQVVIDVASDGIDFMVIKNGDLHFDYFVPWKLIQEEGRVAREILFEDFKDTIIREVKKMANFYSSHWGGRPEGLILITQALNAEITDLIQKNFQFQVFDLRLSRHSDLQASWFAVLGSAFRGLLPRVEDNLISLMAFGTEELFLQSEIKLFIKIWGNIIISVFGFLTVAFLLVDSFLAHVSNNLNDQLRQIAQVPGGEMVLTLQSQAKSFNQLVEKVASAKQQSSALSPVLSNLNDILNKNLKITKLTIDSSQSTAAITGEAENEAAAVDFKNSLIKKGFREVSLPLSNLVARVGGGVTFSVTFKLFK